MYDVILVMRLQEKFEIDHSISSERVKLINVLVKYKLGLHDSNVALGSCLAQLLLRPVPCPEFQGFLALGELGPKSQTAGD